MTATTVRKVTVGIAFGVWLATASFVASAQEDTTTTTEAETTTTEAETTTTAAPETTVAESTTTAPSSGDTTTTAPAGPTTTLSVEQAEEKARVVANLNLARTADVEIARELKDITEEANATLEKIDEARRRIETAELVVERTDEQLADSDARQQEIEDSLLTNAVEGFKSRNVGFNAALLTETDINRAIRQEQLLAQANQSTTDLLEELRGLLEDRRLASATAAQAKYDAERAESDLQQELDRLKEQQSSQLGLKAEAERRIEIWAGELTAYAQEDAAIQQLIGENAEPTSVNVAINNPVEPSVAGFQWPMADPRVTSEYGYRTHPVYGTRRLHAGIDLGAPAGTPIYAANDGVVIFAGTQGGYGRTVIVDHGGGLTTLYAHMSELGSVQGQTVRRGDTVGFVGSSGTATGNHLHFEIRVDGSPTNPRNYL